VGSLRLGKGARKFVACFVEYDTEQAARHAIQVLHGYTFDDKQPGAQMRLSITCARDQ
jgi:hypothetical protein